MPSLRVVPDLEDVYVSDHGEEASSPCVPSGEDLIEDITEFSRLARLPDAQARIGLLLKQGLQQRSDVELHLGRYLAELEAKIS